MPVDRSGTRFRSAPGHGREGSPQPAVGSPAQDLATVTHLTLHAWTLAGRALPTYTRATMPVVVTTLEALTRD